MKINNLIRGAAAVAAAFAFLSFAPGDARAITYGHEDCTDNATNFECGHPNTVSLSGFRPATPDDDTDAELVSYLRCSGSLLSKDDDKLVILTAGHCSSGYIDALQSGAIVDVGVSFDALIDRDVSQDLGRWSPNQYILGGQPVLPKEYTQGAQFDYAIIVFDISATGLAGLETADGTAVDITGIDPVTLPPLNYLNSTVSANQPLILTAAGYGDGEAHNIPGTGGNAGGAKTDGSKLGVRWAAEHTSATHAAGRLKNMLFGSQNPARGDDGTCFGDSGGPMFLDIDGVETQVAITSKGDAVCRASSIMARTETKSAAKFLSCAIAGPLVGDILECGCTEVTSKGVCPR